MTPLDSPFFRLRGPIGGETSAKLLSQEVGRNETKQDVFSKALISQEPSCKVAIAKRGDLNRY